MLSRRQKQQAESKGKLHSFDQYLTESKKRLLDETRDVASDLTQAIKLQPLSLRLQLSLSQAPQIKRLMSQPPAAARKEKAAARRLSLTLWGKGFLL